jgi:hypothetical protein
MELPSALELETLSNTELNAWIGKAIDAIKETHTLRGDDSDQQRLYRALETDQSRRHAMTVLSEKGSV